MIQVFKDVKIDWLANRRIFIAISVLLMLAGLGSAVLRQWSPKGTEAFNLGVDFKGGTVVTARFKQPPPADTLRAAINRAGISDAVIQQALDKPGEFLIKVPQQGSDENVGETQAGVDAARTKVRQALNTFGPEAEVNKSLNDD